MHVPKTNAPDLITEWGWVNTGKSYSLKDFRGKFVLLDFWTFGCINCQHILPDLERLESEFKEELIVVGVHSAKFTGEKSTERIKKAIAKFGIHHPVINDADYKLWDGYGVNAWPTVVLIDPEGKVVGQKVGEGVYEAVAPYLQKLLPEYEGKINRNEIHFDLSTERKARLYFPSKMIKDSDDNIWISDSGNNRILKITPQGKVLDSIGGGTKGDNEGTFSEAAFNEPHGLAIKGDLLYIADTKNNKIKAANLKSRHVQTLAGDGSLDYYFFDDKQDQPVNPNSPWDLLIVEDEMYIASAGNHQILKMNLATNKVYRCAGTGREALADGNIKEAAFNQPSGLALFKNNLLVADAEASAIRSINLKTNEVTTVVGKGLFDFGDKDGRLKDALLQHPVSVQVHAGLIYITDTYNGKLKAIDLEKKEIKTVIDKLNEPNDVLFMNGKIFITDTNNHRIVIKEENSQELIELEL